MADKKIGMRTFRSPEMLATDAIKLQVRLMKMIGPAVEKLPMIFAGRAEGATDEAKARSDMAAIQAITSIFANADPDEVADLISYICELGMVADDGKNFDQIVFDNDFSGSNGRDTIPVVIFMIKETLGDFFSGALASGSQAAKGRA